MNGNGNVSDTDFSLLSTVILHEVKNQLTELQLRLAARGNVSAEQALVANCAQRLTDLLMIQREACGLLQADIDADSPADLLQELAGEYMDLFPALAIEVHLDNAPVTAFYDAFLVRLALANALHNACHHAHARVQLTVRSTNDGILFEITDDGDGYPADVLERGAAAPNHPGQTGTGLGLFLAGRIAALHRLDTHTGSVELSNAEPGGSVFRMRLP